MTEGKLRVEALEFDTKTSDLTLELAQLALLHVLLGFLLLLEESGRCEVAFGFLTLLFKNLQIGIHCDE